MPPALHTLTSPRSSGESDSPAALRAALAHPDDAQAVDALQAMHPMPLALAQYLVQAARAYLRRMEYLHGKVDEK